MHSFVREMTGMMDQHELGSALGEILGWNNTQDGNPSGDQGTTSGSNRRGGKH